ncbi:MAG TPA: hypothetical protein VKL99_01795, partial [Candidatus Angelobacter sp.]|nr:hypothetical protein [Candidatus Angelobacter sp.]
RPAEGPEMCAELSLMIAASALRDKHGSRQMQVLSAGVKAEPYLSVIHLLAAKGGVCRSNRRCQTS